MSEVIPLIYFLLALSWVIVAVSFYMKDYWLVAISGIILMIMGVWVTANGLDAVRNLVSMTFGVSYIGIGAYLLLRSVLELVSKNMP
jgi:hypothetical protein